MESEHAAKTEYLECGSFYPAVLPGAHRLDPLAKMAPASPAGPAGSAETGLEILDRFTFLGFRKRGDGRCSGRWQYQSIGYRRGGRPLDCGRTNQASPGPQGRTEAGSSQAGSASRRQARGNYLG